jgi:hypothetical protein
MLKPEDQSNLTLVTNLKLYAQDILRTKEDEARMYAIIDEIYLRLVKYTDPARNRR